MSHSRRNILCRHASPVDKKGFSFTNFLKVATFDEINLEIYLSIFETAVY